MTLIIILAKVCGALLSIVAFAKLVIQPLIKILKLQNIQSNAIRDLLRQNIINLTNNIIQRGAITNEEIYCLRQLERSYKALEGNGTVEARVKLVLSLPSEPGKFNI